MDQEVGALGPHYVKRLLAGRPFYIAHRMGGTEFGTRARAGCVVARGFQGVEVSVRRCASVRGDPTMEDDTTCRGPDYQIGTLRGRRSVSCVRPRARSALSDIVRRIPSNVVLAIDHKTTSSQDQKNEGTWPEAEALQYHRAFGGHPERRVLWNVREDFTARLARRPAGI